MREGRLDPITSGIPAKITFAVTAVSRLSTQQMLRFYSPFCTTKTSRVAEAATDPRLFDSTIVQAM